FQHLTVQVEAERFDVTMLLSAQQVPGAAQLQVESGDSEACAQFTEFVDSSKPPARDLGQCFIRRYQWVGVRTRVGAADPARQLIEMRQSVPVCAVHD